MTFSFFNELKIHSKLIWKLIINIVQAFYLVAYDNLLFVFF